MPEPRAGTARVVSWDGTTAEVEHDGSCDLVVNRTFYPGWFASVDGGPERPVARAEIGVQAVRLEGKGKSRVSFHFRPNGMATASRVSISALILAGLGTILVFLIPRLRRPAAGTAGPIGII